MSLTKMVQERLESKTRTHIARVPYLYRPYSYPPLMVLPCKQALRFIALGLQLSDLLSGFRSQHRARFSYTIYPETFSFLKAQCTTDYHQDVRNTSLPLL